MSPFLTFILGAVQGITEFLPVSSSGHLVIFEHYLSSLFGKAKEALAFYTLVHFATFLVTVLYLRGDLLKILTRFSQKSESGSWARNLILLTALGSIPAGVVGLGFKDQIEASFSTTSVTANGLLLTSVLLTAAHYLQSRRKREDDLDLESEQELWPLPNKFQAFLAGVAQAVAIAPGVSRSGATLACLLILGLSVETSLKFSFLLSLPAIGGSNAARVGCARGSFHG